MDLKFSASSVFLFKNNSNLAKKPIDEVLSANNRFRSGFDLAV